MLIEELERINRVTEEINGLMEDLYFLTNKSMVKGQIISDMPRGGQQKDSLFEYVNKKSEIEEKIKKLNAEKEVLVDQAESFIKTINDNEIKSIIQKRIFLNETWERIGFDLCIDRRTASRKYYNFFKAVAMERMKSNLSNDNAR